MIETKNGFIKVTARWATPQYANGKLIDDARRFYPRTLWIRASAINAVEPCPDPHVGGCYITGRTATVLIDESLDEILGAL